MFKNLRIPHPVILLFGLFLFITLLTLVIPSGTFDYEEINGRSRVIAGTYHRIAAPELAFIDILSAIPRGFAAASDIIFVVLISGIMFGILDGSGMISNLVGATLRRAGTAKSSVIVLVMTFVYGALGVFVGYENNIALVPVAAVICLAIGGDLMLAAGIAVGGITVGFGLSPINPYTVGIGHQLAQLPTFSGALLRSVLCFTALLGLAFYNLRYLKKILTSPETSITADVDTSGFTLSEPLETYRVRPRDLLLLFIFAGGLAFMLWGVFNRGWYLKEIGGCFVLISLAAALFSGKTADETGKQILQAVAGVAPGAFMVGLAASIKAILEISMVGDTISFSLAELLGNFSSYGAAVFMSLSQCIINFIIPSGSGQALATLPVMIPAGDLNGLTRQVTILAFQVGDGVTNLFNPTLGGLVAMVAICRVPFNAWLKYILPVTGIILLVSWLFLIFAVAAGWS